MLTRQINFTVSDKEAFDNFVIEHKEEIVFSYFYLSNWGETAERVDIYFNTDAKEICARYYKNDKMFFMLVGIWSEEDKKFSFHS